MTSGMVTLLSTLVVIASIILALALGIMRWSARRAAGKNAQISAREVESSKKLLEEAARHAAELNDQNPWPGLASFRPQDAQYFHGRRTEVLELFRLIRNDTITLLFGKSGLGKSSLLNAGVIPLLVEKGFTPIYVRLDHKETAPSLSGQIQSALSRVQPRQGQGTLWEFFHQAPGETGHTEEMKPFHPIIILDQFEEIFTLGRETVARRRRGSDLFAQLADLVANHCPESVQARFDEDRAAMRAYDFEDVDFRVVLSMREEYLAYFEEARQPLRNLLPQRLRLVAMDGVQAMEVVTQAGRQILSPSVAREIINFVAAEKTASRAEPPTPPPTPLPADSGAELPFLEISPAFLSLVCSELNKYRLAENQPAITPELVLRQKNQVLDEYYASCFYGLPDECKVLVEDHLLSATGYRESISVEDALTRIKVQVPAIEHLVETRLLHYEHYAGTTRLEITHDILTIPATANREKRLARERTVIFRILKPGCFLQRICTQIFMILCGLWAVLELLAYLLPFIYPGSPHPGRTQLLFLAILAMLALFYARALYNVPSRVMWISRFLMSICVFSLTVVILCAGIIGGVRGAGKDAHDADAYLTGANGTIAIFLVLALPFICMPLINILNLIYNFRQIWGYPGHRNEKGILP
jgi:hypothetical protein